MAHGVTEPGPGRSPRGSGAIRISAAQRPYRLRYDAFGLDFTDEVEQEMNAWLAAHRGTSGGEHIFDAETLGAQRAVIEDQFGSLHRGVQPVIELFHTGMVVDDVAATKGELTDALNIAWGPEGEIAVPVWIPDGPSSITFHYAYSTPGPHRLELVRRVPDTLWTVAGTGQTHHLGHWCDDVAAASAELERRGLELVAKVGVDDRDAPAPIVYHQAKNGIYIELIDVAGRVDMFGDEP